MRMVYNRKYAVQVHNEVNVDIGNFAYVTTKRKTGGQVKVKIINGHWNQQSTAFVIEVIALENGDDTIPLADAIFYCPLGGEEESQTIVELQQI